MDTNCNASTMSVIHWPVLQSTDSPQGISLSRAMEGSRLSLPAYRYNYGLDYRDEDYKENSKHFESHGLQYVWVFCPIHQSIRDAVISPAASLGNSALGLSGRVASRRSTQGTVHFRVKSWI
jgi:hypothetical protein